MNILLIFEIMLNIVQTRPSCDGYEIWMLDAKIQFFS